jgi:hypothetical protein
MRYDPFFFLGSSSQGGWDYFDGSRERNCIDFNPCFNPVRRPIYHYGLFVEKFEGNITGKSRGIPGSDFVIAGGIVGNNEDWIAGTFMHELGHNLGLGHGGSDGIRKKPNYLSVMNYHFQLDHVTHRDGNRLDYSRFYLADLNEARLWEELGLDIIGKTLGGTGSDSDLEGYKTGRCDFISCSPQVPGTYVEFEPPISQDVDWDGINGISKTPTKFDLSTGTSSPDKTYFYLPGNYNDWDWLFFQSGEIGSSVAENLSPYKFISKSRLSLPEDEICLPISGP